MSQDKVDLFRIQIFNHVVEMGSFTKASTKLNVPKSNISRNIATLESQLGTQLISRTTRNFQLTDAGKILYAGSRDALLNIENIVTKISASHESISGVIRFTAPEDFSSLMAPMMAEFIKLYPQIKIESRFTNNVLNLVHEGIDVSIRAGPVKDSSLHVRKLGYSYFIMVASPSFYDRFGKLISIENLKDVPTISFRIISQDSKWKLQSNDKKIATIINPVCVVDTITALKDLALTGVGLALAPEFVCKKDLEAGRLIQVLPEWTSQKTPFQLLMSNRKERPLRVQLFIDFLIQKFQNYFI